MGESEALNQEFYRLLATLQSAISSLNYREKTLATEWITILKNANSSVAEMKLRNDFISYFTKCGDFGIFNVKPFNNIPSEVKLANLKHLLPPNNRTSCIFPTEGHQRKNTITEMFDSLPDKGAFLAEQPVPKDGTFFVLVLQRPSR